MTRGKFKGASRTQILRRMIAGAAVCSCAFSPVFGQSAPEIPPSVRPDDPRSRISPPGSRERSAPLEVAPYRGVMPPQADSIRFVLSDVAIEGGTVYGPSALEAPFEDLIGREISLAEFYTAAGALQDSYRADGYVLTRVIVPAQRIEDGAVTVRVLEGFVNSVVVQGDVGANHGLIEAMLENLTTIRPVKAADLERYLLLVNDLPGISATGTLRAGTGEPGAAQLVVEVRRKRFDGFVTVSNRASRFTGPWAGAVGAAVNGIAGRGDRLEALYYSTADRQKAVVETDEDGFEQIFGLIAYEAALNDDGTRIEAEASIGHSRPGGSIAPLGIRAQVNRYAVGVEHPFIRSRQTNLSIGARLDFTREHVTVLKNVIANDHLSVLNIIGHFSFTDMALGYAENDVHVTLMQGLPIFSASEAGDYYLTRPEGDAVFTALRAEVTRTQDFSDHWSVHVSLAGQRAFDTLLSQAEFRVGGDTYGRAYDPSELAGEHGVGALTELRYRGATGLDLMPNYEAYGFVDYGKVWNTDNFGFEPSESLSSAGVGARTVVYDDIFVDLEYARTLTRELGTRPEDEKVNQFYMRMTAQF